MGSVIPKSDNTVIAATTGTGTHDFFVPPGEAVTVSANNLDVADVVNIQIKQGASYAYFKQGSELAQLTEGKSARQVNGPGSFRIEKPATTNSVSVHLD